MADEDWKGYLNQLLYGVQFKRTLDAEVAADTADAILDGSVYAAAPAEFADAIEQGLRYSGPLNDEIETPHSEDSIRAFLKQVADALTSRRTEWRSA